jgi:hypothetical protein
VPEFKHTTIALGLNRLLQLVKPPRVVREDAKDLTETRVNLTGERADCFQDLPESTLRKINLNRARWERHQSTLKTKMGSALAAR